MLFPNALVAFGSSCNVPVLVHTGSPRGDASTVPCSNLSPLSPIPSVTVFNYVERGLGINHIMHLVCLLGLSKRMRGLIPVVRLSLVFPDTPQHTFHGALSLGGEVLLPGCTSHRDAYCCHQGMVPVPSHTGLQGRPCSLTPW